MGNMCANVKNFKYGLHSNIPGLQDAASAVTKWRWVGFKNAKFENKIRNKTVLRRRTLLTAIHNRLDIAVSCGRHSNF